MKLYDSIELAGRKAGLLDGQNQQPDPELSYTPNGVGTVRSGNNSLTSLLYDHQLSSLVAVLR